MKTFRTRSFTFVLLVLLLVLLCTGCSGDTASAPDPTPASPPSNTPSDKPSAVDASLVGSWMWDGDYDYTYVFRGDGSGAYTYGDQELTFEYVCSEDSVSILFTNNAAPNVFHYTVDGVMLYIEDSFGQYVTYIKTDEHGNKLSPFSLFDVSFSPAQTAAMSTFMNGGYYAVCGSTVFGLGHDSAGTPMFVRFELEQKGDFPQVADYTIIEKNIVATYVTACKDDIYYIRDGAGLYKVSQTDLTPICIIDSPVDYLQIINDCLYFCNEDYVFCKADLDGSNIEPVLHKEVYYPYLLDDSWLIYQDDADGESLHMRHLPTGVEAVILDTPSFNPILVGSTLYFVAADEYNTMARAHLDAMEIEFDPNSQTHRHTIPTEIGSKQILGYFSINKDGYCNAGKRTSHHLDQWDTIENPDLVEERLYSYNGMDYDIEWEYNAKGQIDNIYVTAHATSGSQALPRFK